MDWCWVSNAYMDWCCIKHCFMGECLTEKPSGMCDTCMSIAYKVIFSKEMSKRMYIRPNSNETEIYTQSFRMNNA